MQETANYPNLQAVYDRLTVLEVDGKYRGASLDRLEARINALAAEIVSGRAADTVKAEARDAAMGLRMDAMARATSDLQSEIKDAKARASTVGWLASKGGPYLWGVLAALAGWTASHLAGGK